jgi:hypothetical protein
MIKFNLENLFSMLVYLFKEYGEFNHKIEIKCIPFMKTS